MRYWWAKWCGALSVQLWHTSLHPEIHAVSCWPLTMTRAKMSAWLVFKRPTREIVVRLCWLPIVFVCVCVWVCERVYILVLRNQALHSDWCYLRATASCCSCSLLHILNDWIEQSKKREWRQHACKRTTGEHTHKKLERTMIWRCAPALNTYLWHVEIQYPSGWFHLPLL